MCEKSLSLVPPPLYADQTPFTIFNDEIWISDVWQVHRPRPSNVTFVYVYSEAAKKCRIRPACCCRRLFRPSKVFWLEVIQLAFVRPRRDDSVE